MKTSTSLNRLTSGIVTDAGQSELLNEIFTYDSDTGSMASKNGADFSYDLSHAHAVSSYDGNSYTYDANGNQVLRELDGENLTLVYDAENRLIEVTSDQPFTPEEINWAGQERQAAETETATPTVTETPTFLVTVIHL